MAEQIALGEVVGALGYFGAPGYVDDTSDAGDRALIWRDLHEKCGVDAAYFKGSVPVVAFAETSTRDEALKTHRRLWNYGRVPILIATTSQGVLALNCNAAQTPGHPDAALLAEADAARDIATVLEDFTRFSVESGRLTRNRAKQLAKQNRVDQYLLRNLRDLRAQLLAAGVHETEVEPLLGRSIFVRYLEDRRILQVAQLEELGQPGTLVDALDRGWSAVSGFFDAMSAHFSGDVFRTDALTRPIPNQALRVLSEFFRGTDLNTGQGALWPYDFSIIPPELISSIYEQLLVHQQRTDAAYYTPRRVVDLVLDEVMPPESALSAPTILDPACGSGIFLTEAFRRLVHQRMSAANATPDYAELSALLVKTVFGVDRNAEAIGVTAFSLYLALLEHVDPRTIWREVSLPSLVGTNLVVSDFFAATPLSTRTFDVIVGNPRPRKRLGWRTPAEALDEHLHLLQTSDVATTS